MKTIITLTTLLTLVFSTLLITGLNNYKNALQATKLTNGSDVEITEVLYLYGFDLDVFDEPTIADYISSNFKYAAQKAINNATK